MLHTKSALSLVCHPCMWSHCTWTTCFFCQPLLLLIELARCCKSSIPWQVSLSQKLNEVIKASRCCIANASNFTSSTFEVDKMCLAEVLVFDDGMSLRNDKRSEMHSRLRNSPVVRGFYCGTSLHKLNVHWSTLFQTCATAKHIHIVLKTHGKIVWNSKTYTWKQSFMIK